MGVVISRYYKAGGYDWIAIPLTAYLYAVDDPARIPDFADARQVSELRDQYRRQHLESLAPDLPNGGAPRGEWTFMVGQAYDRRMYGFQIETTAEQDEQLIQFLNYHSNRRARLGLAVFLLSRNCADFVRSILNSYYPHSVHRNLLADLGVTTPKQVAKSLVKYAHTHPELQFSSFVIEQVPGSRRPSKPAEGIAEALIRPKKYAVPLAFLHPFIAGSAAALYLGVGRFSASREVKMFPLSPEISALWESRQRSLAGLSGSSRDKDARPLLEPAMFTDMLP
jgi:hypothetical protein